MFVTQRWLLQPAVFSWIVFFFVVFFLVIFSVNEVSFLFVICYSFYDYSVTINKFNIPNPPDTVQNCRFSDNNYCLVDKNYIYIILKKMSN